VAAIEQEFGLKPTLKEGHGGIFEVTLNNNIIYTNKNQCGQLPTLEEIFSKIQKGATTENTGKGPSGKCSCGGGG
jgi:predicted Rdx family selenoprotein